MNDGPFLADYKRTPETTTRTNLEEFAEQFAAAYQGKATVSQ
jgi:hypothetical protein